MRVPRLCKSASSETVAVLLDSNGTLGSTANAFLIPRPRPYQASKAAQVSCTFRLTGLGCLGPAACRHHVEFSISQPKATQEALHNGLHPSAQARHVGRAVSHLTRQSYTAHGRRAAHIPKSRLQASCMSCNTIHVIGSCQEGCNDLPDGLADIGK